VLIRFRKGCRGSPAPAYGGPVLVQPAASLTDLALGLVTAYLTWRLPRGGDASRYWRASFAWASVTALIGAAYHGFFTGGRWGALTWAVMSSMVVVVMSFLLAASVIEILGKSRAVVFWPLRLIGFLAYGVFAITGHASILAIMWCESLTMASVIGLWAWALVRHHPLAGRMLVAIGVSIGAAMFRLVPGAATVVGSDPDSAYHVGQIVGMLLLYRAVAGSRADAAAPAAAVPR
jgi:hypothetical protein